MLEMETQEASEDSQNKDKHTPSQLAFFASARK